MPFWSEIRPPRRDSPSDNGLKHRIVQHLRPSPHWLTPVAVCFAISGLIAYAITHSDAAPEPSVQMAQPPTTTHVRLIDINRATNAELSTLPGVGPTRAASIIRLRQQEPFDSMADLVKRDVLSVTELLAIRDLATVYATLE